jgi:OmpA-OmpF porin, OOP family
MENEEIPGGPPRDEGKTWLTRLLPWVVLLISSLALLYFLQKGCADVKDAGDRSPAIDASLRAEGYTPNPGTVSGKGERGTFVELNLPAGAVLMVEEGTFTMRFAEALASKDINPGTAFVLDRIAFEGGTAQLTFDSEVQLNQLVILLTIYPDVKLRLEGHTDSAGGLADENMARSEAYAQSVKTFLTGKGIDADRLQTIGRGQLKPLGPNDTEEGRAANRRVEVYVMR